MINFRFHLVSLVAVFLALALGVVVGSTVIDRAIVDGLESQIERVERNAEDQRRENGDLRQQLERTTVYAEQVSPFAIEGRLAERPAVIFATRGVDENAVRAVIDAVRLADAQAPAVLWLESSWSLVDEDVSEQLAAVTGLESAGTDELRAAAMSQLASRVAAGAYVPGGGDVTTSTVAPQEPPTSTSTTAPEGGAPTTTTTVVRPDVDVLAELVELGLVSVDRAGAEEFDLAAYPGPDAEVVLIDGPDARVAADVLFVPLARALAEFPLLTLAAEVTGSDEEAEPGSTLEAIRSDDQLKSAMSTVDSAETVAGRVAVVLGLDELGQGVTGHYGLGAGASRRVPEPITD